MPTKTEIQSANLNAVEKIWEAPFNNYEFSLQRFMQARTMKENLKKGIDNPGKSPLDESTMRRIFAYGTFAMRNELLSDFDEEEIARLTGINPQPLDQQKQIIDRSAESGVIFQADQEILKLDNMLAAIKDKKRSTGAYRDGALTNEQKIEISTRFGTIFQADKILEKGIKLK